MSRLGNAALWIGLAVSLGGCPTSFSGNAHVVNGRAGCERKCKASKLRMSGMVFLGEYSSACICELPVKAGEAPAPAESEPPPAATSGSVGAAVGVMLQTPTDPEAPLPPLKLRR